MPTVKVALPLTRWRLYSALGPGKPELGISGHAELFFAVEGGELIVSTEPLGDDPSVNPQTEGVYAQ